MLNVWCVIQRIIHYELLENSKKSTLISQQLRRLKAALDRKQAFLVNWELSPLIVMRVATLHG